MVSTLTSSEEAQLAQTIEMFEVITQSQPQDYQSLEILKEAYAKLGREKDAINTSKRIAEAYVQMGQLSSAILEYETILQRSPDDPDVQAALQRIESKATNFPMEQAPPVIEAPTPAAKPVSSAPSAPKFAKPAITRTVPSDIEDGRRMMYKIFVDTKIITAGDFELCWVNQDLSVPPNGVIEPFVQILSDKGFLPLEKSLKLVCDHSRLGYIPMQSYDIDIDLARTFPAETCQRWCIMPFDRMSKCILVATTNPFNQQAAKDLAEATPNRLLWYIVSPNALVKTLRKAFR
jgi:tetratricopeptide (TPR) repeat protein